MLDLPKLPRIQSKPNIPHLNVKELKNKLKQLHSKIESLRSNRSPGINSKKTLKLLQHPRIIQMKRPLGKAKIRQVNLVKDPGNAYTRYNSCSPRSFYKNAARFPLHKQLLTAEERKEIEAYPEIYFMGHRAHHSKVKESWRQTDSNGYIEYKTKVGDHVAFRYEILKEIGRGAFGVVYEVFDHKLKETVALKILKIFSENLEQERLEVKILNEIKSQDVYDLHNIIRVLDVFEFRGHVCFTNEILGPNLYEWLKTRKFKGLPIMRVKNIGIQLVVALKMLGEMKIVHCDLKPENILCKASSLLGVKLIDFGSACYNNKQIYNYIQSRFYRAPEVILDIPITPAIDMWSLGCVLAEIYTGQPLFPGTDEHDQLLRIMQVLGEPPINLIRKGNRSYKYFDQFGNLLSLTNASGTLIRPLSRSLFSVIEATDLLFLDFLQKCLEWCPEDRLTPEQAYKHPWFTHKY